MVFNSFRVPCSKMWEFCSCNVRENKVEHWQGIVLEETKIKRRKKKNQSMKVKWPKLQQMGNSRQPLMLILAQDVYLIFYSSSAQWLCINWLFIFFKIACATAGEARKWMEAFDQAKQQVHLFVVAIYWRGETIIHRRLYWRDETIILRRLTKNIVI